MLVTKTDRGFEWIGHPTRENQPRDERLVSQSSAVGPYDDSLDRAGTSYLWFGSHHHLNREEVRELVGHLQAWLDTGSLKVKP